MGRRTSLGLLEANQAFLIFIQHFIYFMLDTQRAAHCLCIKSRRRQLFHYLPVAVTKNDFLKRRINEIPYMVFSVFIIKETTAWRN